MVEAFLVGGARTPVGRYGGALSAVRPDDLAALVVREAVARAGVDPDAIDEVILGNANGAGEENRNVARMAWLLAGLPRHIPGITVNRLCASGLSAIIMASHMIKAGAADIVVAGGVESMSRAPWVMEKPPTAFAKPGDIFDTSIGWRFANPPFTKGELSRDGKMTYSMPETAEEVARVYGISREDGDAFAVRSHERALAAIAGGRFAEEIVPVTVKTRKGETVVDTDEGPRAGTTMDVLAGLRPVVKGGSVVTAGNASSLNDGASAIIVASEAAIEKFGLTPRARIIDGASAGCEPEIMGIGPVPATRKVLDRSGLTVGDLGAVELNEAFATQSLASMRRLGLDPEIVNRDGGAIALGHPLGSSGSRIAITLLGADGTRRTAKTRPRHHVHRRRPGHGPAAGGRVVAAPAAAPRPTAGLQHRCWSKSARTAWWCVLQPPRGPQRDRPADGRRAPHRLRPSRTHPENPHHRRRSGRAVFASGADIAAAARTPPRRRPAGHQLHHLRPDRQAADARHRSPGRLLPRRRRRTGVRRRLPDRHPVRADRQSRKPDSASWPPPVPRWRLKELVGEPVAKEILLAGRVLRARMPSPSISSPKSMNRPG